MVEDYKSKQWLYEKYWGEGLDKTEIADEAGCSRSTIRRYMDEHGIPTRRGKTELIHYLLSMRPKGWLYEEYWRKERKTTDISEDYPCSHVAILNLLREKGVPVRNPNSSVDAYVFRRRPREWLFNEYWRKGKSTIQIGEENGVKASTVSWIMDKHDPPIQRSNSYMSTGYRSNNTRTHAKRRMGPRGYMVYDVDYGRGNNTRVREHRVTAIGEWGLDAVKGKHVHHANGIRWLNVPEFDTDIPELENPNLVPLDPISHAKL